MIEKTENKWKRGLTSSFTTDFSQIRNIHTDAFYTVKITCFIIYEVFLFDRNATA